MGRNTEQDIEVRNVKVWKVYMEIYPSRNHKIKIFQDSKNYSGRRVNIFLILRGVSVLSIFDTIDYDILMQRLEHGFGIKGTALNWFHSYITGRHFRISVGCNILKCDIPQGSVICPRVVTMY